MFAEARDEPKALSGKPNNFVRHSAFEPYNLASQNLKNRLGKLT